MDFHETTVQSTREDVQKMEVCYALVSIPYHIAAQILSILVHFPQGKEAPQIRQVMEEQVDRSRPWALFDGASQNEGLLCGGGAVLYLLETHRFNMKWGLGVRVLTRT
jgi:hypothetical protein